MHTLKLQTQFQHGVFLLEVVAVCCFDLPLSYLVCRSKMVTDNVTIFLYDIPGIISVILTYESLKSVEWFPRYGRRCANTY